MIDVIDRQQWEAEFRHTIEKIESKSFEEADLNRESELITTAICQHFDNIDGSERWDYVPMSWPAEIPLYALVVNNVRMVSGKLFDDTRNAILPLALPWVVRIELYSNIEDGIMVAGDDCGEVFLTEKRSVGWILEEWREAIFNSAS